MPLPDIQLDDRRFDDLVSELRRRIPAYTPEWTDFNESDPGIALIELFAWLEEILLYRLNKIPDKVYIKLLQLIGIQLNPPAPAQAELTFTLSSKDLPNAILIESGTQVSLANSSGGAPVIFETTDNLYACGATLQAVQVFDAAQYSVVTEINRLDGSSYYAFSQYPQANAALYLGFDRAFPGGGIQYPLTIYVDTLDTTSIVPGGAQLGAVSSPPIIGVWEYWSGDTMGWQAVTVKKDGTSYLTQTGVVMFEGPSNFVAVKYGALKRTSDQPLYWMRYRIVQVLGSGYEAPPRITDILVNTIGAINAVTEQSELLGASNGMPNQTFQISHYPVLLKDPNVAGIIMVDEGDGNGFTLWTEVGDFAQADRKSKVYTLDYPTGIVTFGDGVNGKIPLWLSADGSNAESSDVPNILVSQYRWGGGFAGNAGSNTITGLVKAVPYVASVTNLLPSALGADEETLDSVKSRAPLTIRTLSRAVTNDDFAFLATQTPGARIARATALPLQRPQTRVTRAADGSAVAQTPAPGVVTVIVVPDVPSIPKPEPNQQTLAAVTKWLDSHRLATCELYVAGPAYRLVDIQAQVIVDSNANSGQVADALQTALLAFYNPLTGGQQGTGWDFGGTLYVSDVYGQILKIQGVQRIVGAVKVFVDNQLQPQDQDVLLQPNELVYSTNHSLDVAYPS